MKGSGQEVKLIVFLVEIKEMIGEMFILLLNTNISLFIFVALFINILFCYLQVFRSNQNVILMPEMSLLFLALKFW